MKSPTVNIQSGESPRRDSLSWWIVIVSGISAGTIIGSGSSSFFHWDRAGTYIAGVIVALLTSILLSKRRIKKTTIASAIVTASCMGTIILRFWITGHWPVGHISGKTIIIAFSVMMMVLIPGILTTLLVCLAQKIFRPRRDTSAEQSVPGYPPQGVGSPEP